MLNEAQDMAETDSAREVDANGYMTIKDNPIICAGVFQYKGSVLPGGDPDRIYNVYRPMEELEKPETLQSFQGLPIIDEHEMLGERYDRSPEQRGVHGSILENIRTAGRDVLSNLRIWSRTMKYMIDSGKRGLSMGYNCTWEKSAGVFEGIRYDYIQRNIRGNHLALVTKGRNGTAVLDQSDVFDHFDLALDNGEQNMADESEKKDEKKPETAKKEGDKPELDLAAVVEYMKEHAPMWKELQTMMGSGDELEDTAMDNDTKEKTGDQALDEDKKDEKKEEKKEAMDAADVDRIVTARLRTARKEMLSDAVKRDQLIKDLTPHVGTFDGSAMDAADVAAYGVEKLGLPAKKGHEESALMSYFAGAKKFAGNSKAVGYAMDSAQTTASQQIKSEGALGKRLAAASN